MGDRAIPYVNRYVDSRRFVVEQKIHHRHLVAAKSTTDNKEPKRYEHIYSRSKQKTIRLGKIQ